MLPMPRSVGWIWFLQVAVFAASIAVAISVFMMKKFVLEAKNKSYWEDDKGKTPFTVVGGKVTLTDMQNLWVCTRARATFDRVR